jgi:hypothetical protein
MNDNIIQFPKGWRYPSKSEAKEMGLPPGAMIKPLDEYRFGIKYPLWDRLYDEQFERIKNAYGEEAAAYANYGWGTDGNADRHIVTTKIYLKGGNVLLTSTARASTQTITHGPFTNHHARAVL